MKSDWRGCVPNPPSPLIMPRDINNKYWVWGAYQDRTISRMTRSTYPRSQISTRHTNTPYATSSCQGHCPQGTQHTTRLDRSSLLESSRTVLRRSRTWRAENRRGGVTLPG